MMNSMMGFFLSYCEGLAPSRMPPWNGARAVDDGETDMTVVVTTLVTVAVVVAISKCSQ